MYVDIPLHKWLLEESVRQYRMSPEQYDSTFRGMDTTKSSPVADLNQIQKLLKASKVPFTASEAWNALLSPKKLGKKALEGSVPSFDRKTPAKKTSNSDGEAALTAALTRAGIIPLPEGVRAIPVKDSLEPFGFENLHSKAPFFPLPSFSNTIETALTVNNSDEGPSTSRAAANQQSSASFKASTVNFCLQRGGVTQPAWGDDEAVVVNSQQPIVMPGDGSGGGNVVFRRGKNVSEGGSGGIASVLGIKLSGRVPSVEVSQSEEFVLLGP